MDNDQFYSAEGISEDSSPSKKRFIFPIIMILIIIAGGFGLLVLTGKLSNPLNKSGQTDITDEALPTAAPRTVTPVKTLQSKLATSVKNLTASPNTPKASGTATTATITSSKIKDIQNYIDLAEKDTSLDKSYDYYVKAYVAMIVAYKETKDGKYLTALVDLKRIVVRYPEYKEGDFPIATQ